MNPITNRNYERSNIEIKEKNQVKRELGIARCGLACCLCHENITCNGCNSDECKDKEWCENRKCSIEKEVSNCFLCENDCHKGLLSKMKPYGFTVFAKRYGLEALLDCLERNEKNGVIYHRERLIGDYDNFDDLEKLIGKSSIKEMAYYAGIYKEQGT